MKLILSDYHTVKFKEIFLKVLTLKSYQWVLFLCVSSVFKYKFISEAVFNKHLLKRKGMFEYRLGIDIIIKIIHKSTTLEE